MRPNKTPGNGSGMAAETGRVNNEATLLNNENSGESQVNFEFYEEPPGNCADAAPWWYNFGLRIVPINPKTKQTAVKWQTWLDNLCPASIVAHWKKHPDHELGAIINDELFILDADSTEAQEALFRIEKEHDVHPALVIKTSKGPHHYFRRAAGTYAHMASFSTGKEPEKIDIRTGRTNMDGRSVIVLPPSTGKTIELIEAATVAELSQVDQAFIDDIFRHNGKEPPRPIEPKVHSDVERTVSEGETAEILSYISPDVGYDDWFRVMAGVHDKFNGFDEGLILIDQWSSGGKDYPGTEQIEYKWRSFTSGKGVSFGSVAKMAEKNGADLKEIAKGYNKDGSKRKGFDELRNMAEALTPKDTATVEAIVKDAVALPPLQKRCVYNAIKKVTGFPFSTLKEQERAGVNSGDGLDDLDLAREMVSLLGAENIVCAQAFVWRWGDKGVWKKNDDRSVKKWCQRFVGDGNKIDTVGKSTVESIADLFKTEIYKPHQVFNVGPPECVNCTNGELSYNPEAEKWELMPHTREHFRTTQVPIEYDSEATAPRFELFLEQIFYNDHDALEKIQAVLEMVGYTLMAHCRHERFIILVGGGANGKSVFLAVLEALCGSDNTAGVQPSMFDRSFQRAHLHGKLANIVTEIKQGEVIDDASLKGIVSGEPTTVEHKFKDPFVMRPFATCWFGTNHLPHTRDFSDALFRRALVIEFNQVFKPEAGNCDPQLKDKLMEELPGILKLSLDAYSDALKFGFTMPESCRAAREKWRLEADQVASFVDECCSRDASQEVTASELFKAYEEWAVENGIQRRLGMKAFRDRLTRLGFENRRTMYARMVTGIWLKA
ncbi:MAG: phage/plasmid primase, P4 family [Desulfosalsimonas sp.]|uniref:phage/plasmid primase, P4 family n=1 Tax=Desulfosalsimonas sp. TaxID=3073848 RepID=UPI0039710D3D